MNAPQAFGRRLVLSSETRPYQELAYRTPVTVYSVHQAA